MVWTTHDLSEITEMLVGMLSDAVKDWPLWASNGGPLSNFMVNVTGNSPDNMRISKDGECQLNLYLLHVGQDPFFRNTPVFGGNNLASTKQPLSLNLSYLLTAFAPGNADFEQRVMSIALACFNTTPIYTASGGEYLTISLGQDTLPEMSALWQSFTVAYRLSTIYRVAIAFITPAEPPDAPALPPSTVNLTMEPAIAGVPQLFMPAQAAVFGTPSVTPNGVSITGVALAAAAGGEITVQGSGLNAPLAAEVFLTTLDGTLGWTINGWRAGAAAADSLTLSLPAGYEIGAAPPPPASTPPPGAYLLSVGSVTPPFQSNAVAFAIGPCFTGVTNPPVLKPVGGVYTVTGGGFVPGATLVYVAGNQLGGAQVNVAADGTSFTFTLTAAQPVGALRVRVHGVDAPPVWQVAA